MPAGRSRHDQRLGGPALAVMGACYSVAFPTPPELRMEPTLASPVDEADVLTQILDCGDLLPESVAEAIARRGGDAIPLLIGLLEDDELAREDARGDGFGPIHAAALLGRIGAHEAIGPLLRVLARCDSMELLYGAAIRALQTFGIGAVDQVLEAHAAASSDDHRAALADVLSGLGVRDPRILAVLLRVLEEGVDLGAGLLVEYGDPAALSHLGAALDRAVLDDEAGLLANQDVIELVAAIEDLGGTLSEGHEEKARAVRARRRLVRSMLGAVGGLGGDSPGRTPAQATADQRKKKLRKMRKQAQRRNRK